MSALSSVGPSHFYLESADKVAFSKGRKATTFHNLASQQSTNLPLPRIFSASAGNNFQELWQNEQDSGTQSRPTKRMTDEELLTGMGRGDEAAFLELYERHRDAVFRFAYRMLGTVESAEDVAHDCFLSLIQHPSRFDATRASLRTYLFAAARNLAMKHFRSTHRDAAVDELPDETFSTDSQEPLTRLLDEEVSLIVQRAVGQLPELQREALILFEYEEFSLAEISGIVSADVGTVKARLYRARQALRKSLAGYFTTDSNAMVLEEAYK